MARTVCEGTASRAIGQDVPDGPKLALDAALMALADRRDAGGRAQSNGNVAPPR